MSQSPQGKRRSPRSAISSAERPKTPPKQADETPSAPSPAHQRDLHQKKRRRRSSAIPPVNFDEPETEIFSSPHSGSSIAGSDDTEIRDDADVNSDSDDSDMTDSQGGNNTIEVLDEDEDDTSQSMASARSMGSNNSSGRLDEALRMAAQQAGTQAVAFDEKGDQTMEMEEDVTRSFKPWTRGDNSFKDIVSLQDQENKNPFSPAFGEASTSRNSPTVLSTVEEEMSMDMTTAVGGILPSQQNPPSTKAGNRRKSMASDRRRSVAARRQSSGADSSMEDETMDLTMAIGGIQEPQNTTESAQEDEEMTMEFTSVVGGVLVPGSIHQSSMAKTVESRLPSPSQQLWDESGIGEMDMDMTVAVGGILPAARRPSPVQEEEETMGMDMTTAIGGILPKQFSTGSRSQAKALMEAETDMANLASSPFQEEAIPRSPPKSVLPVHVTTSTTATGSPILSTQRHRPGGRKSLAARKSTTPRREMDSNTPVKNPATPSKQITPKAARPLTPGKTPPSKNVTMRTSSPKTLFKAELKNAGHTPKSATPRNIFTQDLKTGISTPSVILTPRRRRSSGLGLDREGLGSPRVAALLDRRRSIGEDALSFTAQQIDRPRAIHFEDPKDLEREIEQERFEEQAREDGRAILEREADVQDPVDREATVNLKELIETLSPKKKIAGRKSLHVGAAKGLLGKRPAELDDEDQENSPKRLKGRAGSPVKNIMLPPPPSKTETTGRLTRASRKSLAATTSNGSQVTPSSSGTPAKDSRVTTPRSQGRFKDVEVNGSAVKLPLSFDDQISEENMEELEEEDEKIHLQDFLNMTSIRFMELTTTKRRHTVAPNALEDNTRKTKADQSDSFADQSVSQLEACVVAGACTVPMLELYQHVSLFRVSLRLETDTT
jgi:kinetochore protein Spc7/SPC105